MRLASTSIHRSFVRRLVLSAGILSFNRSLFSTAWTSMGTHTTERDGKGTVTVSPKDEASQSGLVVICHGLGDTAEGFADVAEVSKQ
jgi:alpha-beta hydrolase superfamily lysophospholipase